MSVHKFHTKNKVAKAGPVEPQYYTIRTLAVELNITARAIRFYESKGLIQPLRIGSQRLFSHADRARLQLILRGKRLGFSLAEVADYLDLYDADPAQLEQMRLLRVMVLDRIVLLESQRRDIDQTLDELRSITTEIDTALHRLNAAPTFETDGG